MNQSIALMYHDVLHNDVPSGFNGPGANAYKVSWQRFDQHLDVIAKHSSLQPSVDLGNHDSDALYLTFDDGGASAFPLVADRLEARGWRGIFFVTSARIDNDGFLPRAAIAKLDRRGHLIGSHSHNHPLQMATLKKSDLREEWERSCHILEDIVGHPINVASIPGGMYSESVAQSAASSGITDLFTSEPRRGIWATTHGCRLHGRYTIKQSTRPEWIAALVAGKRSPRWRQRLSWESRKVMKRLLGPIYLRLRGRLTQ